MAEESLHIHQGLLSKRVQLAVRDGVARRGAVWEGPVVRRRRGRRLARDRLGHADHRRRLPGAARGAGPAPAARPRACSTCGPPAGRASTTIGCAACHVPTLELDDPKLDARHPAEPDRRSVHHQRRQGRRRSEDRAEVRGAQDTPTSSGCSATSSATTWAPRSRARRRRERSRRTVFLTRPLWGLAETAPYLHDGRAPTRARRHRAARRRSGRRHATPTSRSTRGRERACAYSSPRSRVSRSSSCHDRERASTIDVSCAGRADAALVSRDRGLRTNAGEQRAPPGEPTARRSRDRRPSAWKRRARRIDGRRKRHALRLREAAAPGSFLREMHDALDTRRASLQARSAWPSSRTSGSSLFEHEYNFADGLGGGECGDRRRAGRSVACTTGSSAVRRPSPVRPATGSAARTAPAPRPTTRSSPATGRASRAATSGILRRWSRSASSRRWRAR